MERKYKSRIYPFAIIGFFLFLINSCNNMDNKPIVSHPKVPELITLTIADATNNAATCGGTIINDGGETISISGVCWSKDTVPTLTDNKTSDNKASGSFTSSITGLTPNTVYYVRAYATNSVGTGYGNTISFKTLIGSLKAPEEYTHKVLVEYTTCCHCSYCPDAEIYLENLITKYGSNTIYGTAMHNTLQGPDMMETPEGRAFSDAWTAGNPTGTVNRITGKCEYREKWDERAKIVIDDDEKCGLAIDAFAKTGTKYNVKVKVGIGRYDLPIGQYYVIAYLTKKEMSGTGNGWDQTNGFNGVVGHPMYQKGNPIKNYIHTNVFIKSLNTMNGTLMNTESRKAGALSEYGMELDMAGLVASEYEITAMVFYKSATAPFVENVQRVTVGQIKAFD